MILLCAVTAMCARSPSLPLAVHGDTNRDGRLDNDDLAGRGSWSWESGPFIMANLDDDDGSGLPDAYDRIVNGKADEEDLARFRVLYDPSLLTGSTALFVETCGAPVNVFQKTGDDWIFLTPETPLELNQAELLELGVEARTFAGIEARLKAAGVKDVRFINDRVYQDRWGNVHCATNTLREPPAAGFWTRMTGNSFSRPARR